MKKVVLKVDVYDDKSRKKLMKIISTLSGLESIAMDMKEGKLTVTGDVDPSEAVSKVRKLCHAEILTVGPAKEERKDDDEKKDPNEQLVNAYKAYYPYTTQYYYVPSAEENPNACVIS